jgi:hypothetical protein
MLAIDAFEQVKSGHRGAPMGMAISRKFCGVAISNIILATSDGRTAVAAFYPTVMVQCFFTDSCVYRATIFLLMN